MISLSKNLKYIPKLSKLSIGSILYIIIKEMKLVIWVSLILVVIYH